MAITGQMVADFLGRGDEPELVSLAQTHVGIVIELAKAYTRGKGFNVVGTPNSEISAVLVMATARVSVNPEQVKREAFGEFQNTPGTLYGWTLTELAVLNRYRKKNTSGPRPPSPLPERIDGGGA